ncbi:hypothetical protein ACFE04_011097 [Oxalis oulophora]
MSIIFVVGLLILNVVDCQGVGKGAPGQAAPGSALGQEIQYPALHCRKHTAKVTDYGAVGDGKTLNTKAFNAAIANLSKMAGDGGVQLIVPPGKWLTGSFNLTSYFTLFLHKGAVILGAQEESEWPRLPPLPSYGLGRDAPGGRFSSLIFGTNLTDVVITGHNGTLDGQGEVWWKKFKADKMDATRPYMIEFLYSDNIQISNITLLNSPSWNIHPTYCSNVLIQGVTVLAPTNSPNTDGINPDSCLNTRIEDSYIVSGDDCIAVKSGWDEYGIKFGMPTKNLTIKRVTCISPDSALIALGSEMSGGIQNVRAEDITAINTQAGIRIKTAVGRGAYVKDIYAKRFTMKTMDYVFRVSGDYGDHPGNKFDPKAMPEVSNINFSDMVADNVTISGKMVGIDGNKFTGICISNVTINLSAKPKELQWNCTNIDGVTSKVTPKACDLLPEKEIVCPYPTDKLPLESLELKTCILPMNMLAAI